MPDTEDTPIKEKSLPMKNSQASRGERQINN